MDKRLWLIALTILLGTTIWLAWWDWDQRFTPVQERTPTIEENSYE